MQDYLSGFGLGYLVGIAVIGYALVLYGIKKFLNAPQILVKIATILHLMFGLIGFLLVPSLYVNKFLEEPGKIVFSITLMLFLLVAFLFSRNAKIFSN